MKDIQREDIHIISKHSNLDEEGISKILEDNIYYNRETWQKFLRFLFLTLGVGFTVAGIIFFFAYNWADLNKFAKIGLVELLLIATTSVVLFAKTSKTTRNIILTGSSMLVGALFAVYGQIYQTGANAYDFFLGWTLFITLWVIISDFAPLWLLFLLLINTTFILYTQQVARDWSPIFICTFLFLVNASATIFGILISESKKDIYVPKWFLNIVSFAAISFATFGIMAGITDQYDSTFPILVVFTIMLFALGIWYSFREKNVFYLAVIPVSLIIIISTLLFEALQSEAFLLVSLFVVVSITLVIWNLITLQKKWKNEK